MATRRFSDPAEILDGGVWGRGALSGRCLSERSEVLYRVAPDPTLSKPLAYPRWMLTLGPHTSCMALHLFRPAEPSDGHLSPSWRAWRGLLAVELWRVLALLVRVCQSPRVRHLGAYLVVLVGLVVQGAMILTAAYLIDLGLSLMELWADLAKKHLELTL